jgi:hypothetical protein
MLRKSEEKKRMYEIVASRNSRIRDSRLKSSRLSSEAKS